jgi:antitoxin (DNA-binding transcriptional repressor) of toxin-antitoxin stability system
MEQVGIRELKSNLSSYIRRANAGEIIVVTDRGKVVAQLRAPGPLPDESELPPLLLKAAGEGKVKLGQGTASEGLYSRRPVSTQEGTALRLLDEMRGER